MADVMAADPLRGFLPGRTALLVVDMQHGFASPGGLIDRMGADLGTSQAAVPLVARLLTAARRGGILVVHLRVVDAPGGASVGASERARRERIGLALEALPEGGRDSEIVPEAAPGEDEVVVTKRRLCGFVGTDLDIVLRSSGVTHLVVAGLQSHACVLSTAWIGSMLGYHVAVPEDATASPRADLHQAAMTLMRHSIHAVTRVADLERLWQAAPVNMGEQRT
ncbi:MAG: cysteine hydrolase family protein [Armatimonadota bacterium]